MLHRISTIAAAAAIIGLCALPASAATAPAAHPSNGSFTVPSASSAVTAWGSYAFTTRHGVNVVKVSVCAELKGSAFAVIAEAETYNSSGTVEGTVAAVVSQETPGHRSCGTAYLRGTAHLKVFSGIGSGGKIVIKSKLKSIY
jgi:hypothetical protein